MNMNPLTMFLMMNACREETEEEKKAREKREIEGKKEKENKLNELKKFIKDRELDRISVDDIRIGDEIYASNYEPTKVSDLNLFEVNMIMNECFGYSKAIIVTNDKSSFPMYLDTHYIYRKK